MTVRGQRRFLAMGGYPSLEGMVPSIIMQGYLLNDDGFVVRVRRVSIPRAGGDEFGMISIKGPRAGSGDQLQEEFAFDDVTLVGQVLRRCRWKVLKRRYPLAGQVSLDLFDWSNAGLVVAEVRSLPDDLDQGLPGWLGPEVTGEMVFNNEWLARRPWQTWSSRERNSWLTEKPGPG